MHSFTPVGFLSALFLLTWAATCHSWDVTDLGSDLGYGCFKHVTSADGRYVISGGSNEQLEREMGQFLPLCGENRHPPSRIWLLDMLTGTKTLIDWRRPTCDPNVERGDAGRAIISADGNMVLFRFSGQDLNWDKQPLSADRESRLFLWRRQDDSSSATGSPVLQTIDVQQGDMRLTNQSFGVECADTVVVDNNTIAYQLHGTKFVPAIPPTQVVDEVYLHDLVSGSTDRISTGGSTYSALLDVSNDGKLIALFDVLQPWAPIMHNCVIYEREKNRHLPGWPQGREDLKCNVHATTFGTNSVTFGGLYENPNISDGYSGVWVQTVRPISTSPVLIRPEPALLLFPAPIGLEVNDTFTNGSVGIIDPPSRGTLKVSATVRKSVKIRPDYPRRDQIYSIILDERIPSSEWQLVSTQPSGSFWDIQEGLVAQPTSLLTPDGGNRVMWHSFLPTELADPASNYHRFYRVLKK